MYPCPRCIKGQVGKDWDGLVCIQCGHRPNYRELPKGKIAGKREPRLPGSRKR